MVKKDLKKSYDDIMEKIQLSQHSLEEAHDIAKNVIARGVGINKNDDLALDESFLK